MIELFQNFTFDAAHNLGMNAPDGHSYGRLHGHSFTVTIYLRGEPDPKTGWLLDLADVETAIKSVHARIDHHYLNDVEGLEVPTLENIGRYIWNHMKPSLAQLHRVTVARSTLGQGCTYEG